MEIPEEVLERSKNQTAPDSSKILGLGLKTWWLLLLRPIEDYLIEIKVHPNVLTITTLIVSILVGLMFHLGLIFMGGILLLSGSTFDIFDGRVARAQGLSSQSGAFFDSCLDRIAEAFIYLGILSYFQDSYFALITFLILGSTTMVSYTKARAEGLNINCDVGMMQRTERVVYLGVFSVFNFLGNLTTQYFYGTSNDYLLKISLILLLLFSSYTAYQRMTHVMKTLEKN